MPAQKNRNRLPPTITLARSPEPEPAEPKWPVHHLSGSALAEHLMDPQRTNTVVIVSHIPGNELRLNAQLLATRMADEARVFELSNGTETHRLQEGLPDQLHVFGTGARVYPYGHKWAARVPRPHVLRHAKHLGTVYDHLEQEVMAAQHFEPAKVVTAPIPLIAEAVVMGFPAEDRAMVELVSSGAQAVIRSEDLLPGIPLDWLVSKGQKLTGTLDADNHVLNVAGLILPRLSPIKVYAHGDVALARVTAVCPSHATVQLWPGNEFRICADSISSNDLDSVEDLLTVDEVVRVRVLYENGAVHLSMLDVDDDEPAVPAPCLLLGGPPWLDSNRPYASIFIAGTPGTDLSPSSSERDSGGLDPAVDHENQRPRQATLTPAERRTALQSTQMQLEAARRTIAELAAAQKKQGATDRAARALQDQLAGERKAAAELARLLNTAEHQVDALKDDLARTKASLVQLRQQRRSASSRSEAAAQALFLDPAEQFAFELYQTWARVVAPVEKPGHPLGSFTSSPLFLASLEELTDQQRTKTLRAVVDLVADRQGLLRKREPHPLRMNEGAHAAPTLRGEDVCMRLYVEQGTAGALRLHYWKLAGGGVELHEVVTHDVVKP